MSLASLEQDIPAGDLLLLDTTTVASYFKGNEAASPVATYVVDQWLVGGRNPAVVSVVSVMELLVSPMRDRDDALYRQVLFFLMSTLNLTIADISFQVAHEAAALRASHNFKAPDALIMGTGRALSVRHFVCNDSESKKKLAQVPSLSIAVCYLEDHIPFPA